MLNRMVGNRVSFQSGRRTQRNVRRSGQPDRRAARGHAPHRTAGRRAGQSGHTTGTGRAVGRRHHATCTGRHARGRGAGHLQVFVAQPHNGQNRAPPIGLHNRIDTRVEPRAHQRFNARDGQLLIFGIGQVNHLGHKVAAGHLIEVFFRKLNRHGVVRQIRVGARHRRRDLQRRIQFQSRSARNIHQLQPINRTLRKVVAPRSDQRLRVEQPRAAHIPNNLHAFRPHKRNLRHGPRKRRLHALRRQHPRPRTIYARPGMQQLRGGRQVLLARQFAAGRHHQHDKWQKGQLASHGSPLGFCMNTAPFEPGSNVRPKPIDLSETTGHINLFSNLVGIVVFFGDRGSHFAPAHSRAAVPQSVCTGADARRKCRGPPAGIARTMPALASSRPGTAHKTHDSGRPRTPAKNAHHLCPPGAGNARL